MTPKVFGPHCVWGSAEWSKWRRLYTCWGVTTCVTRAHVFWEMGKTDTQEGQLEQPSKEKLQVPLPQSPT